MTDRAGDAGASDPERVACRVIDIQPVHRGALRALARVEIEIAGVCFSVVVRVLRRRDRLVVAGPLLPSGRVAFELPPELITPIDNAVMALYSEDAHVRHAYVRRRA